MPGGDLVEAFLEGDDLLAADDHAVAVVGGRRADSTCCSPATRCSGSELLTSIPGVTVDVTDGSARPADGYDLAIYNGVAVPADPGAPFIAVAPPGGLPATADESAPA